MMQWVKSLRKYEREKCRDYFEGDPILEKYHDVMMRNGAKNGTMINLLLRCCVWKELVWDFLGRPLCINVRLIRTHFIILTLIVVQ